MNKKIVLYILLIFAIIIKAQEVEHIKYYKNGKIKEKGQYQNSKQTGLWTYYYKDGQISDEGKFVNDLEEGEWKSYYENGQLESIIPYKNGEKHGAVISYHKNGKIAAIATAINGEPDGEIKSFNEDGNLLEEGKFVGGKKDGIWIKNEYYENGQLKTHLKLLNNERHGVCKSYYENGALKEEIPYKNGDEHGDFVQYHQNGKIRTKGKAVDGNLYGIVKDYWENGNLKKEVEYNASLDKHFNSRDGKYTAYFENGLTEETGYYSNGQKSGLWKDYVKTGKLKQEATYKNGELNGVFKFYFYKNKSNNLSTEGIYKNNERVGRWNDYNTDGTKEKYEIYDNGNRVKTVLDGKKYLYEKYTKVGHEIWEEGKLVKTVRYDEEEKLYKINFRNKTKQKVGVVIRILDENSKWVNHGWYNLEPGETAYLKDTKNRIFYYYAEAKNKVWKGSITRTFKGYKLKMKKFELAKGKYGHRIIPLNPY